MLDLELDSSFSYSISSSIEKAAVEEEWRANLGGLGVVRGDIAEDEMVEHGEGAPTGNSDV